MRIFPFAMLFACAMACSGAPSSSSSTSSDTPGPTASADDGGQQQHEEPQPTPCVPGESCLDEGVNTFLSDGTARTVTVLLPETPHGAPVVFAWHYLGGSAEELITWMQLRQLAAHGYVVVVPSSRGLADTEWDVISLPDSNADVRLFDGLRQAVQDQHSVDSARIYATGFSAGGLFTTFLTMHRSSVLAATAPFSGGTPEEAYVSPTTDIPVLVSWGGASDNVFGFDFDAASRTFATKLAADGHEVIMCNHGLGHWLPDDAAGYVLAFFDDHGTDPALAWNVATDRIPQGCERP